MGFINVGLGFMLMISGRPAYWIFTGTMAFLLGNFAAAQMKLFSTETNNLVLSLMFAVFGVLLAFLFHRWTARAGAFFAGGFLIYNLPVALGSNADWATPVWFVVGGLVALSLTVLSFDFAIMMIAALTAVTLVLRQMHIGSIDQGVMFLILVVFSLITQYLVMQYAKPSPD
ncbi:MAG: hypothetical protein IT297_00015 [Anaerolineae bacterium]|nr:hypothetical protein [Anaerolineae bacterium]